MKLVMNIWYLLYEFSMEPFYSCPILTYYYDIRLFILQGPFGRDVSVFSALKLFTKFKTLTMVEIQFNTSEFF